MNFKSVTVWIFVILIIIIFLLLIYPTPMIIGVGVIGIPVLLILQAYIILSAKEESKKEFKDGQWYDKP
ncbi:MAG: hypothetical protein AAFO07_13680 [Bacteroidota bacterium]